MSSEMTIQRKNPQAAGDLSKLLAQLPPPNNMRMKIISIGSAGVGKSCIIKRFCEERFIPKYISTIGIDYGVKKVPVEGRDIRVNFWDLAGGPEYLEIRCEFYKDAQGAILVYDVTNQRSFLELEVWLGEASKYGAKDLIVAVCANKCDLPKRAVSEAEGRRWATGKGFSYFETSALSGQGVPAMFEQLFRDTYSLKKL